MGNFADKTRLLCGNSNRPLAEKIAEYVGVPLSPCEVSRFSDGEIFVQINENVRGRDVFIIQSTNSPAENLLELVLLIDAARRASAMRITALIPYYGYARQDRKDQPRVSIGAKVVANMLVAGGANRVITMDLHASQIQGFFDVPSDHLYAAKAFYEYFADRSFENTVVVSPDIGSIKMARAFAKKFRLNLAIVDKRRPVQNKAEVLNIIGDVEGMNVIIRDDMIDTAGTTVEAAYMLKERGAKDISVCATHKVLSGNAVERIEKSPISKVIVTDTIYHGKDKESSKIETITTAPIFGEAIIRTHKEESISRLFKDL